MLTNQTIDRAISPWNRAGIENSPMFAKPPRIADCTLRDGEQQSGVVFSREDKVALAKLLDSIGVHDLEVGTPAVSEEDRQATEEIAALKLNAMTSALARATRGDVDLVARCGVDAVRISLPISDRQRSAKIKLDDEAYLTLAQDISSYAKERDLQVIFSPYDTTRADLKLLERLLAMFNRTSCVDRVRVVDTTGAATPEAIGYLVKFMLESSGGIPLEIHCHDDFGLGTANTIAGALAGAAFLSTTINGLGERSGNAALEEVVVALKVLYGLDLGIQTEMLVELSREVEERSGVTVQRHKPVVGRNSFSHETGMVVAGLVNDPFTAEAYSPEIVGQRRSIVLGKKSGKASVEFKLKQLGIMADQEAIESILADVKDQSIMQKRALDEDEFQAIVQKYVPERVPEV